MIFRVSLTGVEISQKTNPGGGGVSVEGASKEVNWVRGGPALNVGGSTRPECGWFYGLEGEGS